MIAARRRRWGAEAGPARPAAGLVLPAFGLVLPAFGLVLLATGCARIVPPSGGPEDREAPRVVAHQPDSAAVGVARDAPLVLVFSERMQAPSVRDWLLVAPWPGRLECEWDSSAIVCRPEQGWDSAAATTVLLGTEARDQRGNRLERALAFAFTTGESLPTGVVTGIVRTRALKAGGLPVALFPWPAADLVGPPAARAPAVLPDPRDALRIGETDAEGRFRLDHVPRGEPFLVGAMWDEKGDRRYDDGLDLWAFHPEPVRGVTAPPPAAPAESLAAPAERLATPAESLGARALGPEEAEIYLVFPDEPGDVTGVVADSACAGYTAPAIYRAQADSLRAILRGDRDAQGFAALGDSLGTAELAPAESESLQAHLERLDSLLTTARSDSLRCGGAIWVTALAENDTVPAGEVETTGSYELSGLDPGIYRITAFRDLDGDDRAGAAEPRGAFPHPVEVLPGRKVGGVEITLATPPGEGGPAGEDQP